MDTARILLTVHGARAQRNRLAKKPLCASLLFRYPDHSKNIRAERSEIQSGSRGSDRGGRNTKMVLAIQSCLHTKY